MDACPGSCNQRGPLALSFLEGFGGNFFFLNIQYSYSNVLSLFECFVKYLINDDDVRLWVKSQFCGQRGETCALADRRSERKLKMPL